MSPETLLSAAVWVFSARTRDADDLLGDLGGAGSRPVSELPRIETADLPTIRRARVDRFRRWLSGNGWSSRNQPQHESADPDAPVRNIGWEDTPPAIARLGAEAAARLEYAVADAMARQVNETYDNEYRDRPLVYQRPSQASTVALPDTAANYLGEGPRNTLAHEMKKRGIAHADLIAALTEKLCDSALTKGWVPEVDPGEPVSGGNTALAVAILHLRYGAVVKADTNKKVAAEAGLLKCLKDTRLKNYIPTVLADSYVGHSPVLFGYLMEIAPGKPLADKLVPGGDASNIKDALDALLMALAPWYWAGTSQERNACYSRVRPDFEKEDSKYCFPEDVGISDKAQLPLWYHYFGRVIQRFKDGFWDSVPRGLVPTQGQVEDAIGKAAGRFDDWCPGFTTPIHGDPNPENVFWDGQRIALIDPKDWEFGDYIFDMGKIGHYLRVTARVERCLDDTLAKELEDHLQQKIGTELADPRDDSTWKARYEFAVASSLLGIVATRKAKADKLWEEAQVVADRIKKEYERVRVDDNSGPDLEASLGMHERARGLADVRTLSDDPEWRPYVPEDRSEWTDEVKLEDLLRRARPQENLWKAALQIGLEAIYKGLNEL